MEVQPHISRRAKLLQDQDHSFSVPFEIKSKIVIDNKALLESRAA